LIFSIFLPPLVFEAALCIEWKELQKDLPVVALLATASGVLAAAVTGAGMHYPLEWDWASAIVFGVLIAATDPVSVIAMLVAIVLVTFGRAVAIYPLCAVFARSALKVERRHQHLLFWRD
jgi:NhaP-type Na+/H+ or K+/H+ antiporter